MNKLKLAIVSSLLITGIAHATTPACNGFQIKVKNNLADDLLVTNINLNGADMAPGGIQKLTANTEQAFTVNNSLENLPMTGTFVFHTISLPSKEVKINFTLQNSGLVCEHTDASVNNVFSVDSTRLPGTVNYSIANK